MKKIDINQLIKVVNGLLRATPKGEARKSLLLMRRELKKISAQGDTIIDKGVISDNKKLKDFLVQLTKVAGVAISLALWKDFWEHIAK